MDPLFLISVVNPILKVTTIPEYQSLVTFKCLNFLESFKFFELINITQIKTGDPLLCQKAK